MNDSRQLLSLDAPEHNPSAKSYDELLVEYHERKSQSPKANEGRLITVPNLPEGKDVYNPSGPFSYKGKTYQWFRIESHEAQDAVAMLAEKNSDGVYVLIEDMPVLPLEDPFITFIGECIVVGGVEIHKDEHDRVTGYRTAFYRGTSVEDLTFFAYGPEGMKDIRMLELTQGSSAGRIHVFTRPHLPIQGRMLGRIATTTIDSLSELEPERLAVEYTEWIYSQFTETEWGGVNNVYELGDDLIGALAHISKFDDQGKRHYAAASFIFNRTNGTYSPLQIIAERGDFPMGPIKIMPENLDRPEMHDDLADVIFSSSLTPTEGTMATSNTVILTCGLSDAAVGELEIPNPFKNIIENQDT